MFKTFKDEGIAHFGLMIFQENKVIFKEESASERDKQKVALLMAQNFANLVKKKLFYTEYNVKNTSFSILILTFVKLTKSKIFKPQISP